MPSRKTPSRAPASSGSSSDSFGERELIVVAKPQAGLRAMAESVATVADANVDSLNSVLRDSGARLVPLFGNEDRVARTMSASAAAFETTDLPALTTFYRVVAEDEQLDELAYKLLETNVVEAAFVKPPAQPPVIFEQAVLPPSPEEAPPVTPSFDAETESIWILPLPELMPASRQPWLAAKVRASGSSISKVPGGLVTKTWW